jgi:hypothetical protein
MRALVSEFQSIPWNARGRKVGRILTGSLMLIALTSPMWVEAVVFRAVGQ